MAHITGVATDQSRLLRMLLAGAAFVIIVAGLKAAAPIACSF